MSFEKISKLLKGDTPGRSEVVYPQYFSRITYSAKIWMATDNAAKGFLIYRKKIVVVSRHLVQNQ